MNLIQSALDDGRQKLANNSSVEVFADANVTTKSKLAVVPHMAFWVLGFADAMQFLLRHAGDDPVSKVVRQHASEDADHWKWFVSDLVQLQQIGVGSASFEDALLLQWGTTTEAVRECAWQLHSLLRSSHDPAVWLTVIECCEAGFDAFMSSMRPVIVAADRYTSLAYFGQEHDHAEAGHTIHEASDPFVTIAWTEERSRQAVAAAQHMFAALERMHSSYGEVVRAAQAEGTAQV